MAITHSEALFASDKCKVKCDRICVSTQAVLDQVHLGYGKLKLSAHGQYIIYTAGSGDARGLRDVP